MSHSRGWQRTPSRLQPLTINSFLSDFPEVVQGGSTVLRWDVSKDATQVSISPMPGDVDIPARSYSDISPTAPPGGFGPAVFPTVMADPASGTNAWFLGARNGNGSAIDYTPNPLIPGAVYDVWIDITNAPMNNPVFVPDTFSVYLQIRQEVARRRGER